MLNTLTNVHTSQKRVVSALLRAPTQVPDPEKVKYVFQTLGYSKCVSRVTANADSVSVRTNIQSLGVISAVLLAEKLSATDVELGFSRSGLIFLFKYR